MIQEIINFSKEIGKESITPQKGLNILLDFNDEDKVMLKYGIYISLNKRIESDFLENDDEFFKECAIKAAISGNQVHQNKRFVRQIKTNSPYCTGLSFQNESKLFEQGWEAGLKDYFDKATKYLSEDEVVQQKVKAFQNFLINSWNETICNFFKKIDAENEKLDKNNQIKLIRDEKSLQEIYCFLNIENSYYEKANKQCLKDNAAGMKGSDLSFSKELLVYPSKKKYLPHHTAPFDVSYATPNETNNELGIFFSKLGKKDFPKPLPIFIDSNESNLNLNDRFVKIYNKSGKKKNFKEILEDLFAEGVEERNIQNFYLLNAFKGKSGFVMQDFEFVPQFRYKLEEMSVTNVFSLPETPDEHSINTIFDFHEKVIQPIFNWKMSNNNFFNDLTSKSFKNQLNTYRLVQRYRKPIFDFIYKSKVQAISGMAFKDIVDSEIKDAFTNHQMFSNRKFKEERIKQLLNIYFSINHHFDPNNINFHQSKDFNMAKTTKDLMEQIKMLTLSTEAHIEAGNDEFFAFCLGQLIHYLVSQNQSSKKSHSLLMPYLQKNDFKNLREKVKEDIKKYGYAINFNNKRFNKISAEIMGFSPAKSLQEMKMFVLAGYFAQNVLYSKS